MIAGTASPRRCRAGEAKARQVERANEEINDADDAFLVDPILQAEQKHCLVAILALDEPCSCRPPANLRKHTTSASFHTGSAGYRRRAATGLGLRQSDAAAGNKLVREMLFYWVDADAAVQRHGKSVHFRDPKDRPARCDL